MKRLTCEMCGSNDIIKQDGFFVCQACGLKYTLEEAKKLMVEGVVEVQGTVAVQGTVNIDTTKTDTNYLTNARRALQKEDWTEAEKYYNLLEQNEPSNIEAVFFSSYANVRYSMVESDHYKRLHSMTVFCNSISIIDDNYTDNSFEFIRTIDSKINDLCASEYVYLQIDKPKHNEITEALNRIRYTWVEALLNIALKIKNFNSKRVIYEFAKDQCLKIKGTKTYPYRGDPKVEKALDIAHDWLYNNCEDFKIETDKSNMQKVKEEIDLKRQALDRMNYTIKKYKAQMGYVTAKKVLTATTVILGVSIIPGMVISLLLGFCLTLSAMVTCSITAFIVSKITISLDDYYKAANSIQQLNQELLKLQEKYNSLSANQAQK